MSKIVAQRLAGLSLVMASLSLTACSSLFHWLGKDSLEHSQSLSSDKLAQTVSISRDEFGVPLVEASNIKDLAFGMGYAMAEDRLGQMVSMSLLAKGRLSEMVGDVGIEMDTYMRTLGLPQIIANKLAHTDADIVDSLNFFAAGVNAYLAEHEGKLPLEFKLAAYTPEPWQAEDSIAMFTILALGVGFNVHEELAFLHFAQKLGWEKAAYLAPIYQGEPIDLAEAKKISGLDLSSLKPQLEAFQNQQAKLRDLTGNGLAASNNWGIAKSQTQNNKSIIANDTHLLLTQPATWSLMALKSPELSGVGITLAGIPALVAGYNGHIGWGETMVMADSMDVFIEQLRVHEGVKQYLYQGQWLDVERREETIKVNRGEDKTISIESTRHGPLINSVAASEPRHALMLPKVASSYGLALSWTANAEDDTVAGFFALNKAKNMQQAKQAIDKIGYIHLNIIYGDGDNIAWQVTGLYPNRKQGTGHFPSPGWSGDYDWQGFHRAPDLPYVLNPEQGYVFTANHKTVANDYPVTLTNSWYYPERAERTEQMLLASKQHTAEDSVAMQADRKDLFAAKLQVLLGQELNNIKKLISSLPGTQAFAAKSSLEVLLGFDGQMLPESWLAAVYGEFETQLVQALFVDEIGNTDSNDWRIFLSMSGRAYSAYQDHVIGQNPGPYWDNVETSKVETKAEILTQALVATWLRLEDKLGADPLKWQWGQLVHYHFQTEASHLKKYLPWWKQKAVGALAKYTDLGPYPAGGNRNTLNVAGYDLGADDEERAYKAWNIPAMRLVVDFSLDEPVQLTIAGSQSGNPASPHYRDAHQMWVEAKNRTLVFNDPERVKQSYQLRKTLLPSEKVKK